MPENFEQAGAAPEAQQDAASRFYKGGDIQGYGGQVVEAIEAGKIGERAIEEMPAGSLVNARSQLHKRNVSLMCQFR